MVNLGLCVNIAFRNIDAQILPGAITLLVNVPVKGKSVLNYRARVQW